MELGINDFSLLSEDSWSFQVSLSGREALLFFSADANGGGSQITLVLFRGPKVVVRTLLSYMRHTLTFILGGLLPALALGDVVINEISATSAPRNLRWDENDQAFAGAGPAWWSAAFDDGRWEAGQMPIGYSLGSISTNLSSDLSNLSPSFYTRKTFEASPSEASSSDPLVLTINYNDGFIAWLNGVEVARRNMGAEKAHIFHDQLSHRASTLGTSTESISLGVSSSLLVDGDNVLAVQVNNYSLTGNMRLDTSLEIDRSGQADLELFAAGGSLKYLPGLREMSADLVEPALPGADPSDWIELHNSGGSAVDLAGWTLSDAALSPDKWAFPAGTTIAAGGYLVVLADNPSEEISGATYLHTNFKLDGGGEDLALFDDTGSVVSILTMGYPRQYPNFSYGRDSSGTMVFHANPTPSGPNTGAEFSGKADAPDFDKQGGFYDDPIAVVLTSQTAGAMIRYTTDGTEPTLENGNDYTLPLSLARVSSIKGHVIRARAFLDGHIHSNVKTHTFLIGQDVRVRSAPSLIYAGDPERALYDPFGVMGINGGRYVSNRWQPNGIFDYNNVVNRGRAYERPIHAEFYFADGTVGFRSDVGLRVASSSYSRPRMQLNQTDRSPWPDSSVQKPSFNLYFRDDYGNSSVDLPLNGPARTFSSYERFRIRAGKNDIRNPFVIDELFRRLSHDMGNGASLGIINSLYVNGELKGYYNMVERLREPFFKSLYGSESKTDWDVLQYEGNDNIAEGDKVDWNDMIIRLNASDTTENWERVLEVADVENMANYYLLNIYGATWDWPHNNWVAAKERSPQGKYRLYVWDAEGAMNNAGSRPISQEMIKTYVAGTANGQTGQTGTRGELRDLWRGLNRWEEFRLVFADQIQKHLFNGGILDDRDTAGSHIKSRFDGLVGEFSDLLRLVENQAVQTGKFNSWVHPTAGRRRYLLGPTRQDFRVNNLWPDLTPPQLNQFGGTVGEGFPLLITNAAGTVYYTTDGSDPRLLGGTANPGAVSQPGSLLDVTIFPIKSEWAFNDSDGDLGTAWRLLSYDDDLWLTGDGPLGYGSIKDEETVITIGTEVNQPIPRQPTTYFRKTFEIDGAATYLGLDVSLRVDGGVIIYLNGVEAFRESNIPDEAVYDTNPTLDASDGNEGDLTTYSLDSSLLIEGANVIAVELHNKPGSSDMVLDVALDAKRTNAANLPVFIDGPMTVKARSFQNGEWSAMTSADFTVNSVPASVGNLAIAEMLYNPAGPSVAEVDAGYDDGDMFEFLRLENLGNSTVNLGQVRFTDGVVFDFGASSNRVLRSGEAVLIVSDLDAFRFRYGNEFDDLIAGEYEGQLSNGGEQVRLIGFDDTIVHEFEFNIDSPWPVLSDLDGHSIQIIDRLSDHGIGGNWRASSNLGGTPGGKLNFASWQRDVFSAAELSDPSIAGPNLDPDHDGWSNFLEFSLGSLPGDVSSVPATLESGIETIEGVRYLTLTFSRAPGERSIRYSAEISEDLESWREGGVPLSPETVNLDGSVTATFRHPVPIDGNDRYMRLKVVAE